VRSGPAAADEDIVGNGAAAAEPHEVIYEQAMRRLAALDDTWRQAVRGVTAAVRPAVPALPPLPRPPMTVPAEVTAGADTAEAVVARSASPRWRRSLAY
jgi:hypothetical protein